jgi:hypothetical protein
VVGWAYIKLPYRMTSSTTLSISLTFSQSKVRRMSYSNDISGHRVWLCPALQKCQTEGGARLLPKGQVSGNVGKSNCLVALPSHPLMRRTEPMTLLLVSFQAQYIHSPADRRNQVESPLFRSRRQMPPEVVAGIPGGATTAADQCVLTSSITLTLTDAQTPDAMRFRELPIKTSPRMLQTTAFSAEPPLTGSRRRLPRCMFSSHPPD